MYSGKNIEQLGIPDEVVITSLSEYINELSLVEASEYYFRGENNKYSDVIASGLRNDKFEKGEGLKFLKYIEEFYKEVAYKIDINDKKNFICFSQHYGIPTNLVDITKNPLIALYFACEDNNEKNEYGFVYLFERNNIIDISNYIELLDSKNLKTELSNMFMLKSSNSFMKLYTMMNALYQKSFHKFKFYLNDIIEAYERHNLDFKSIGEEKIDIEKIKKVLEGDRKYLEELIFDVGILKERLGVIDIDICDLNPLVCIYILLIACEFRFIEEFKEPTFWINFLPIFSYEPIVSFDRIKSQQGLFFYQSYLQIEEEVYGSNILARQRIWPEKVIVINNKEKILKELDTIGINKKSVFGDFDSIAQYIINKY